MSFKDFENRERNKVELQGGWRTELRYDGRWYGYYVQISKPGSEEAHLLTEVCETEAEARQLADCWINEHPLE